MEAVNVGEIAEKAKRIKAAVLSAEATPAELLRVTLYDLACDVERLIAVRQYERDLREQSTDDPPLITTITKGPRAC